jgi:hypothetical protein
MPDRLRRHRTNTNLAPITTANLSSMIRNASRNNNWNSRTQQKMFNFAMTLYNRRGATLEDRRLARGALHRLVHNYNRTWSIHPPATRFRNSGYLSELNSIFNTNRNNNGSNSNSNSARNAAARKIQSAYRRYRSAKRGAAKRTSPKRSPYTPRSMRKIPRTNLN